MNTFKLYNRILGWLVFLIAAITYILTAEPTVSLWDCGEFIASAFKLQVGHPPGAPFFMILARVFTLFAGDNLENVAFMVNVMSALASAFTIMFLFWTINHLALKITGRENLSPYKLVAVLGSGLVGALAYTFSDTFWFSAVEGEVYALSSLFTAIVFWAILKWENDADEPYSNRWLIFIAYLMGLSIGVHLLNLLAIPAIVMVYYFRKYTPTRNGVIGALFIGAAILGGVMYVLIPGLVWMASKFELIFVNGFGMPYKSGVIVYAFLLVGALGYGIYITHKRKQVILNTAMLMFMVIVIGYSSYSMIVIRSMANPPMDENNPDTIFKLQSYLNREQYGDRPLVSGQYFNAQVVDFKIGKKYYSKRNGRYEVTNEKTIYKYDKGFSTIFPRMYSADDSHISEYLSWANIKEKDVFNARRDSEGNIVTDRNGNPVYDRNSPKSKPSFAQNIRFMIRYQIGHMYMRYFMWNFAGRQNDIQGNGEILNGNWISGIPAIDKHIIGDGENMPDEIKDHKAYNRYYMLPFLLGLFGLFYHYLAHKKDFWVVMMLFLLTGFAIIIYLNQYPLQPRERDYAYAASFYAFAIWIGLGVMGIIELGGKALKNAPSSLAITLVCLLLVPGIMASENWDDHNRSGRYTARDIAYNYLMSCAPNAIIFTNGDNDTFPLWYAQDVEGIRTDVRVVNLMLLNMDWYADQMTRKAYESDPLPITFEPESYADGTRDIVFVQEKYKQPFPATEIVKFIASDNPATKVATQTGKMYDFVPTKTFTLAVDSAKVIKNGVVKPKDAHLIEKELLGTLPSRLTKSDMIALDMIAHNNWERPIYFVATGHSGTLGLDDYLQLEGFAYRLVPIKTTQRYDEGRIDTDILYDNFMNKFKWGRMNEPDVYMDHFHLRTLNVIRMRIRFTRLANSLIEEGDFDRAGKVLDRIVELTPHENIPYDYFVLGIAEAYYRINQAEKGNAILSKMLDIGESHLDYYLSMNRKNKNLIQQEISMHFQIINQIGQLARAFKQPELADRANSFIENNQVRF
ncbi:MAG: DUF2723 domain-containing protein [Bacteroidota bacterium]|nr:MAG: DUF2723 domain-containing protein [Bacteroidota bacterium]